MGGALGGCDGTGGSFEHQRGGAPHARGKAYIISANQNKTLQEVADLENVLSSEDITNWHSYVLQEQYKDEDRWLVTTPPIPL